MSRENCSHGNSAPRDLVQHLHPSQAGAGRHKCPVCAFHAGLTSAAKFAGSLLETCQNGSRAPVAMLSSLPDSQGGKGRHRCCVCAFAAGVGYSSSLQNALEDIATAAREEGCGCKHSQHRR